MPPHNAAVILQVEPGALHFFHRHGKAQRPVRLSLHRLDKFIGDQQAEVELPQATVFALGADKVHYIGVVDIEGAHLGAATPAGR